MLEIAFLCSHLLWMTSLRDMEILYDMVTRMAGKAMNIKNHKIEVGAPANLVVLNAENVYEAILYQAEPRYVISRGRIVAENEEITRFHVKI